MCLGMLCSLWGVVRPAWVLTDAFPQINFNFSQTRREI
jgi:hypothetical protein